MIAGIALRSGRNAVKRIGRSEDGGTITHTYHSEMPLLALAQELGIFGEQYARIICNTDGSPAETMLNTQGGYTRSPNFSFEVGEEFCVVELQHDRFWISEVILEQYGSTYQLVCEKKTRRIPIRVLGEGTLAPELACFVPAIEAGIGRMGCRDCAHVHYSRTHMTQPTQEEAMADAQVVVLSPENTELVLGASHKSKAGFETTYLYTTNQAGGFAIAQEKGGQGFGFATVVCHADGSVPEIWATRHAEKGRDTKFRFEVGVPFAVVRLQFGTITVSRCVVTALPTGYKLLIEQLDEPLPLGHLREGMQPEKLAPYAEAILAAMARLACPRCQHTHYGK